MKNIIFCLFILTFTNNLKAAETASPYANLRESSSVLITKLNKNEVLEFSYDKKAMAKLNGLISKSRCATRIISGIHKELGIIDDKKIETAILALRIKDAIDDISAGILINAARLNKPLPVPFAHDDLTAQEEDIALGVIAKAAADLRDANRCFEDSYKSLVGNLSKESPRFTKSLKHIFKLAKDNDLITQIEFKKLEKMRNGKVHLWPLTLAEYEKNLSSLARSFPERNKESSELMTDNSEGKFRNKKSLRQTLHEKYDSTQIVLMANLIRDLKKRLDATSITININYENTSAEVIDLSAMEKFRFILKLLRKELSVLNHSSLLHGKSANYIDLIAAAYEVGYVSAEEIAQLAALEDIWHPQKTPKEKIMIWVKRFGGVASVLLPPPYGFVSVLAIMIIDQQISEAPIATDPDYNIF